MTITDEARVATLEAQVEALGTALTTAVEHLTHMVRRVSVLEQAAHLHVDTSSIEDGAAGPSLIPAGPSDTPE